VANALALGLAGVVLAIGATTVAADPTCRPKELTTRYGDWTAEGIVLSADASIQSVRPLTNDGKPAVAMRLLLAAPRPSTAPWKLAIRDGDGHLLALVDKADFPDNVTSLWTGRLNGSVVSLALRGGDRDTEVEVRGAVAIGSAGDGEQTFSIKAAQPDWRPLYPTTTPMMRDAGEAVGILVAAQLVGDTQARETWSCTGVMIAPALFLTNWHCGGGSSGQPGFDGEVRSSSIVDLEWEDGAPVRRQFSVTKLEMADEALDFAILRLKPASGNSAGDAMPVAISTVAPAPTDPIFVIHHAGGAKKLVSGNCRIRDADWAGWTNAAGAGAKPELTHDCDTSPGASGAPVFNIEGAMIGLHHLGFDQGPGCAPDRKNKAVKITAIATAVRSRRPDLLRETKW